jgi:peptide/nickel transport system substrate-binding protein
MTDDHEAGIGRRLFIAGHAGLLGTVLAEARPAAAQSAARRGTLVIGLDISDPTSLDPARVYQYSNPLPTHAAYESLVTFAPGDYITLRPQLATEWSYQPDGRTIRFKLRQGVKFPSGKPMTAEDVQFGLRRVINIKDQPAHYVTHIARVTAVDAGTLDIELSDPSQPVLTIIAAPEFVAME